MTATLKALAVVLFYDGKTLMPGSPMSTAELETNCGSWQGLGSLPGPVFSFGSHEGFGFLGCAIEHPFSRRCPFGSCSNTVLMPNPIREKLFLANARLIRGSAAPVRILNSRQQFLGLG